MEFKLREYQKQTLDKAREEFARGKKSICVVSPCRSGKSVLAAYIAKQNTDKQRRVLFMVHRIELCEQITKTFENFGVDMTYCDVVMVQTITRHIAEIDEPYIIITDEAHHSLANTYKRIYEAFPNAYKIYFTATPVRLDGKGLGNVCESLVVSVTCDYLQDNNYLARYDYYAPTLADFSDTKKVRGEFDKTEVYEKVNKKAIYGDIVKHYQELCNGKQAIAYCASVEHSQKVAKEFNDNGIAAEHIDGKTPKEQRKRIMDDFRDGKIKILCNYEIVGEGLDVPDCEVCLLMRATASLTLFVQMACRCLTYKPNKRAIILDFVGNYTRFGMPTQNRVWDLRDGYKKEKQSNDDGTFKIRVCKKCYGTFETAPVCPYCGEPYITTHKEIEQITEARLQKVEQNKAVRRENFTLKVQNEMRHVDNVYDCKSIFELVQWCKVHGKKQGYAYIIAKKKGLM